MSFAEKFKSSLGELVYLVRGKDKGREAWHYVFLQKTKSSLFLAKLRQGSLDVADYGEVLYSGWGKNPPESIVQKIKERFGG